MEILTKQTGEFQAKTMLRKNFGGLKKMKRIISIESEVPDHDQSTTLAKKLQQELPTKLEIKKISLQDLSHLSKQLHVVTREAATNTDLVMGEFLTIGKALRCVQG